MKERALYRFGDYTLNPSAMSLRRGEEPVRLAPKVFDTLSVLVQQRGEVVTKQHLLDAIWPGTFVEEGNLAQNVFLLRKSLGQTAEGAEYIETLSKRGYRMNVPVHEVMEPAEQSVGSGAGESIPNANAAVPKPRTHRKVFISASVLAAIIIIVLFSRAFGHYGSGVPAAASFTQITHDTRDKRGRTGAMGGPDAALLTDGKPPVFHIRHLCRT